MSSRGTLQQDSLGNGKGEKLESNLKSSLQEKDRLVEPYFTINLEFMDSSLKEKQVEKVHRSVFHCNYIEQFIQFYLEFTGMEGVKVLVKIGLDGGGVGEKSARMSCWLTMMMSLTPKPKSFHIHKGFNHRVSIGRG